MDVSNVIINLRALRKGKGGCSGGSSSPEQELNKESGTEEKYEMTTLKKKGEPRQDWVSRTGKKLCLMRHHISMFAILALIILFYLKRTTLRTTMSWHLVSLPLYILMATTGFSIHKAYALIISSHTAFYNRLLTHLLSSIICLAIFVFQLCTYLDDYYLASLRLFLVFLPLYLVLISTFGIFLYLLPGMCDPEINPSTRVPFLILNYMIIALLSILWLNLNGISVLESSDGFTVFYPLFFGVTIHLIMAWTTCNNTHSSDFEARFITCLFLELLTIQVAWNIQEIPISVPMSGALLVWMYAYYEVTSKANESKYELQGLKIKDNKEQEIN